MNFTVIVADDSRSMREFIVAILEGEGVRKILQAQDGEEAMRLLASSRDKVDLIYCDLAMPGIDGVETMRRIAASRLEPAIVLISGHDQKILQSVSSMSSEMGLRVVGALRKPLTQDGIVNLLKESLLTKRILRARKSLATSVDILDEALAQKRLEMYYQPQVRLSDGKLTGVEALVRINDPALDLIGPDQFIPVAESTGRIMALTTTVLESAISQAGRWRQDGLDLNVAVNVSTLAISGLDLPDFVAGLTDMAGIAPDTITIELTESQIADGADLLHVLSRLRLQGFRLSIDDYGTGQSGLQRLKRLPFSELKIDKAFVKGASRDADMRAILEVSIHLGQRLRMEVVAEGVDNWQDWSLLKDLGCDIAQGFFIAEPMPAAGISLWAKSWKAPH